MLKMKVHQFRGLEEAAIALIVGVFMQIVARVAPGFDWKDWKWTPLTRLGLCIVFTFGIYALDCFTPVDVPGFDPICGWQGAFNAAVVGFLAFLVNKFAETEIDRAVNNTPELLPATLAAGGLFATILVESSLLALGALTVTALAGKRYSRYVAGVFDIKLSIVLLIGLAIIQAVVRFPGNLLGLPPLLRMGLVVLCWGLSFVVMLLARFGVIQEV